MKVKEIIEQLRHYQEDEEVFLTSDILTQESGEPLEIVDIQYQTEGRSLLACSNPRAILVIVGKKR